MAVLLGAIKKDRIKKTSNVDYTILLGEIVSKNGNIWNIYQKDITRRKGDYYKFEWRIVRKKDSLILPTSDLPKQVSAYDFLANKSKIKSLIDLKEATTKNY